MSNFARMRIAVNTRFLLPAKMEGFGWYTFETVQRLVTQHPEHTFIFFFDRPFEERFVFGPNVIPVVLRPPARHPLLFILWFELAVHRALKKYRADVFFSPDGYLSLRSKVPQIPVIHDLNFEHHPQDLPWSALVYLRYFFPKFAKKAAHILTVSDYSKQDIVQTYGIDPEHITVAWNGVSDAFQPLTLPLKEAIENEFANGSPYFLFVGALHPRKNIGRLLQAFEKYRQTKDATYHLVIVGENLWKNKGIDVEISEKTKEFIHFTGHLPLQTLTQVTGAASCLVFVPYFEGFGIPIVEAMRCGTPVIAGTLTSLPEVAGDAALYCDPIDVDAIAAALENISTDPALRQKLSDLGIERAKLFSWDYTAAAIWSCIERVSAQHLE
jgi:glycosyltransferase involved in cell wall biosynthesis